VFYACLLAPVLIMSGDIQLSKVRLAFADGLVIQLVPESSRQHMPPLFWMYPDGSLRDSSAREWKLTDPAIGSRILRGNPDGTARLIDVVFVDESRTGLVAILSALGNIKRHSESVATRLAIGRPNAVICLRSKMLDRVRAWVQGSSKAGK
jgi:hypothetical protein